MTGSFTFPDGPVRPGILGRWEHALELPGEPLPSVLHLAPELLPVDATVDELLGSWKAARVPEGTEAVEVDLPGRVIRWTLATWLPDDGPPLTGSSRFAPAATLEPVTYRTPIRYLPGPPA